ncbi:hypothetical protein [Portibacter lacus]|uniref:VWA domain-containing protein n=1 Tax=Portibacter lacus TaxID=1099794 RepID=A0AA37SSU6_9BACT|nr:hypothetical protein [Portibacter lacus]GLR19417.1 hypothetical protein GCM10007940_40330 [Portibacter lacus]
MSNLTFQYNPAYIFLCLLVGLVFAFALYYREKKFLEHGRWLPILLGALRFLAVSGFCFLLMVPLLKSIFEETKNPVIVIAKDASSSVTDLNDTVLDEGLANLKNELSSDFQVDEYSFSNDLYTGLPDSNNVKSTNLEKVFTELDELYINQNVGAIIIATDGIYNEGKNPLYIDNNISAPIYPIALGDTIERKDLILKRTLNNDIVFLGDKFSVQLDIEAINSAGENSRLTISKYEENGSLTSLESRNINIDNNDFFITEEVVLEANQSGVVRYVASLSPVSGEVSRRNNRKDIFIEVLDSRQKILLLANAPHPDVSAFKHIIENNKNYELNTSYLNSEDIPNDLFDLVILHNLPSTKKDITAILNRSNIKNAARLYVLGSQTSQSKFNQIQNVFSIEGSSNSQNEVQATLSNAFTLFKISEDLNAEIVNYPPMVSPFGNYKVSPNATVLLKQKIGKVDTEYPLLAFNDQGGIKTGVIAGEGIWKWRLFNYLQKSHYDEISELVNKSLQYLTLKEDKRKFRASPAQNIFKENEPIIFSAELYNDSYEKINTSDVNLTITNADKNSFNFVFSKRADYYFLDAGQFPAGNYRYTAEAEYEGKKVDQSGRFSVESIQLESFDLTARHDLLRSLASKSGGQLIQADNTGSILEIIKTNNQIKPTVYASTRTNKLMDHKWIFFLLFGFLAVEWFLRRYFGSY